MPQKNVSRLKKLKDEFLAKKRKLWAKARSEYFKKLGKDYNEQFDSLTRAAYRSAKFCYAKFGEIRKGAIGL